MFVLPNKRTFIARYDSYNVVQETVDLIEEELFKFTGIHCSYQRFNHDYELMVISFYIMQAIF